MRRADLITAGLALAVHAGLALAVTGYVARPSKPPPPPVVLEFKRREPPAAAPVGAPAPIPRTLTPPRAPSARKVAVRARSVPAPAPAASRPSAAPSAAPPPVYAVAMTSTTEVGGAVAVQATGGGSPGGSPGGTGSGPPGSTGVGSGGDFRPASARDVGVMPEVDVDACGRAATYPKEAEQSGIEGDVRLRVALNERGQVHNVKVLSGLGRGLDAAAVEAIKHRCKFKPAIDRDGRTVAFVIESYKFHFELPH